jgi:hypothetical protein
MIRLERKHGVVLLDDEDSWLLRDYFIWTSLDRKNGVGDYIHVRAERPTRGCRGSSTPSTRLN